MATPLCPPPLQSDYLHMVKACAERDRQQVVERSTSLGFLTGALGPLCVVLAVHWLGQAVGGRAGDVSAG